MGLLSSRSNFVSKRKEIRNLPHRISDSDWLTLRRNPSKKRSHLLHRTTTDDKTIILCLIHLLFFYLLSNIPLFNQSIVSPKPFLLSANKEWNNKTLEGWNNRKSFYLPLVLLFNLPNVMILNCSTNFRRQSLIYCAILAYIFLLLYISIVLTLCCSTPLLLNCSTASCKQIFVFNA